MTQWGLDALFNPAKRDMDEEKRRLQTTREQIGDSSGGDRIDFESGKVTIRRSQKAKADEIEDADAQGEIEDPAEAEFEDEDEFTDGDKAEAEAGSELGEFEADESGDAEAE